jgi:zona occludens toxin (predicted ATPase)
MSLLSRASLQNVLQVALAPELPFIVSVDTSECLNSPMVHNAFIQPSPLSCAGFPATQDAARVSEFPLFILRTNNTDMRTRERRDTKVYAQLWFERKVYLFLYLFICCFLCKYFMLIFICAICINSIHMTISE